MMSRDVKISLIKLLTSLVSLSLVSCENSAFLASTHKSQTDESLSKSHNIQDLAKDNLAHLVRENSRNNEKPRRQFITDTNGALIDVDQISGNMPVRVNEDATSLQSIARSSDYFEKMKRSNTQNVADKSHGMKIKNNPKTNQNMAKIQDRSSRWFENICSKLEYYKPKVVMHKRKKTDSPENIDICNSKCETVRAGSINNNNNNDNSNLNTQHKIHKRSVNGIIDEILPNSDSSVMENAKPYREIKIAATLPAEDKWLFSIKKVRPAIEIALEKMNPEIAHHNAVLTARFRDSKCVIADGINEAINFYVNDEMDVMFGPCCDYPLAPCARQAVFWNRPIISAGGLAWDFGLGKPREFSTLTRLGSNHNTLVEFFAAILQNFNWKKVNMVYDPNGQMDIISKYCHIAANDLHYGMRNNHVANYSIDYVKFEHPDYVPPQFAESFGTQMAGKLCLDFEGHRPPGYKQKCDISNF